MKFNAIFLLIITIISLANSVKINPLSGDSVVVFSSLENNSIIEIKENQIADIIIKGNPTTGYTWFLNNTDKLDKNILTALNLNEENSSSTFIPDKSQRGTSGTGGSYHFMFTGVAQGQVNLEFVYKRPWETDAVKTNNYLVKVLPK